MTGELLWRNVIESHVRPSLIVIPPPGFDDRSGILHGFEPMHVQAFVAKRSIEAFRIAIVGWLAGAAEVDSDIAVIRP